MDFNISDLGVKRIVSIGGFIFIILLFYTFEKQTNYLFYTGISRKIDLLDKIAKNNKDSTLTKNITNEYKQILSDLSETDLFKINDFETSLGQLNNRIKYGKKELSESDKYEVIQTLESEIDILESEVKNLENEIKRIDEKRKDAIPIWLGIGLVSGLIIFSIILILDNWYKVKKKETIESKQIVNEEEKKIEVKGYLTGGGK